jgi:hypothetical protein
MKEEEDIKQEFDGIFSELDQEEETDIGEVLLEIIEPHFELPRKIILGEKLAQVSIPKKKKFRDVVYHKFNLSYNKIKSYEAASVTANLNRISFPLNWSTSGTYHLGEVFIFGFSYDEAEWYAFDIFTPNELLGKVSEILFDRIKRPQLQGLTHFGNLAAVKYVMSKCQELYQYQIETNDWIKGSKFMRQVRGKYERYSPSKDEQSPPTIYIFKEGFAQVFSERSPSILHQMSTFWPWNLIKNISEKDNKIKLEWYDDTYSYEQIILDNNVRQEIINICSKILNNNKPKKYGYAPFIRSNSFPSHFDSSWSNLEPFACEASRSGLPPKKF